MKCEPLCEKKERKYIKTPLCGKCQKACGGSSFEIFDGQCFCNSIGTVNFKNQGDCSVKIFKNGSTTQVATIEPGCCFTLTSAPLYKLEAQCSGGEVDCCLCWEGCVCSQVDCCM